jgi:hypothetical protein
MELRQRMGPRGLIIVIRPAIGENPGNQKVADLVDSMRLRGDQRLYELRFPPQPLRPSADERHAREVH